MKILVFCLLMMSSLAFGKNVIVLNETNTVQLNEAVSDSSVAVLQSKLLALAEQTDKDIYLVLFTPGGSITAGMQLIDTINAIPNKVHTITIFAASMGYQIVQNAANRYIMPSGTLMSHRPHLAGLSGSFPGELNKRITFFTEMVQILDEQAASRVGLTLPEYAKLIHDEYWVTGRNAVSTNHADEVILAKCDKSLKGTYEKVVRTFFGAYNVKFSRCPLVIGVLGVKSAETGEVVHDLETINNVKLHLKADHIVNINMKY